VRRRVDVAIIGAGFGGLAMAHQLRQEGIGNIVILERDAGVGGTWRANSYPGAACDVPSHLYSLSFAPNPWWSRTYAGQPEILHYLEGCYDRLGVRDLVRCSTEIESIVWHDDRRVWQLRDSGGSQLEARIVVSAVGLFHTPAVAELPGLADFCGTVFHSARWRHDHDLRGRRVAVVGTGASAIQIVPSIAGDVAQLTVFQRTPAWIVPRKDEPFTREEQEQFASDRQHALRLRTELYDQHERNTSFNTDDPLAAQLTLYALGYLEHKVADPELRASLTPNYPIGCKRILVSSDFYPALQRSNVELVTDGIEQVLSDGIRATNGVEHNVDTIVLCTGFRATEYLRGIGVTGRHGTDLQRHWSGKARAHHGMSVPGFPNFFLLYGPNTNQGGNSIILILEAQARYVAQAVRIMRERQLSSVEVRPEAMEQYSDQLEEAMTRTVWNAGCDSYFRTAAGEIVTQLPHTAGWYCHRIRRFELSEFDCRSMGADEPVRGHADAGDASGPVPAP